MGVDCEGVLEIGGLRLQCQLGEHAGLHSVSGAMTKIGEDGEPRQVTYRIFWDEQRIGSGSEEVSAMLLEWLSAA
jgi:hypothetical protein